MHAAAESIDISRNPDDVFAYATDFAQSDHWQGNVVSVRPDGQSPPRTGSKRAAQLHDGVVQQPCRLFPPAPPQANRRTPGILVPTTNFAPWPAVKERPLTGREAGTRETVPNLPSAGITPNPEVG